MTSSGFNPDDIEQQIIQIQAEKIASLIGKAEKLGAKASDSQEQVQKLLTSIQELEDQNQLLSREISRLREIEAVVVARLGNTPEQISHQVDVLFSYVAAMGSPGHRAVTFLGKKLGRGRVGRVFRRAVMLGVAFRKG